MPSNLCPALKRNLTFVALLAIASPAFALLNIDGTRNQLFVFGGVTFSQTSNLFSESAARSDYTVTAQVGAELQRHAGIISVSSTAKIDFVRYGEFTAENSVNPSFAIEFTKSGGRTTGSLSVKAYRETRSDSAVNLLTSSWNLPIGLNLRYPINEKFYVTSATGYLRRTYNDNPALVSYTDLSEAVDLNYVYTSKLDLLAGYRIRVAQTSVDGRTYDHWFNVGATGGIFSKMTGTVRFGYQFRDTQKNAIGRFDHFNASASLNWPVTRKVSFGLIASRDFNTIATGTTADSTSLTLNGTYAYSRQVDFHALVSAGRNEFLDPTENDRRDTFFSWEVGGRYRMNEHFQIGAAYTYLQNWSTNRLADFDSQGFSVDISSRF